MTVHREIIRAASDVLQNKKDRVRVLGRGLVRKISDNLDLHAAILAAPPMCPLHVWRGEGEHRSVFILKIMPHTHFKKTISYH